MIQPSIPLISFIATCMFLHIRSNLNEILRNKTVSNKINDIWNSKTIELICRKHLNLKFLVHFRVTCHQMSNKCVFITCINELFYLAELTKKTHIETSNRCNTCQNNWDCDVCAYHTCKPTVVWHEYGSMISI